MIKVGIDIDFAPYEWGEGGNAYGFNVDMIELIAEKLDWSLEFYPMVWTMVLEGVKNESIDILFGNYSPILDEFFDFSPPFVNITSAIFVHDDVVGINNVTGLVNHTVAVGKNYPAQDYLDHHVPTAYQIPVDTIDEGIDLLFKKEVFVFFGSKTVGSYYIQEKQYPDLKTIGSEVDMGNLHIVVNQGNQELLGQLNTTLQEIIDSGEFSRLYDEWLGKPLPSSPNLIPPWLLPVFIGMALSIPVLIIHNRRLKRAKTRLEEALEKVRLLSGLIPICANCKKIRDVTGYWSQIEAYIQEHSEAVFSHGFCPECTQSLYGEFINIQDESAI